MNDPIMDFNSYKYQVAAFYCFSPLQVEQINSLKEDLISIASKNNILGTIIIASEGINGTICGKSNNIIEFQLILERELVDNSIEFKYSYVNNQAFRRFKVKHKHEIVTMGVEKIDPNKEVGKYISPLEWNEFINDPDTLIIDTRNEYEVGIGTFKGSLNPHMENFREFPNWVDKNFGALIKAHNNKRIGMFCTGGIRCEKATSLLLKQGFSEVYHLKGGILKYLEVVSKEDSLWEGECFVFDQRVALDHELLPGDHLLCYACGMPLNSKERQSSDYIRGVKCSYCKDSFNDQDRIRFAERQKHYDSQFKENLNS